MKHIFFIILLVTSFSAEGVEFIQDYNTDEFDSLFNKAKNGDIESQEKVAKQYLLGIGVKQSDDKAIYWYKKIAELGLTNARNDIAVIYKNNNNYYEAYKWFYLASLDNYESAKTALKDISHKLLKYEIQQSKVSALN